jgi:hypothetical protein
MPVAGEVVPLNPDGTVPEGAYFNPAAGVALVIPGGILDTGSGGNTTSGQGTAPLMPGTTNLEQIQGVYLDKLGRSGEEANVMNWVNAVNSGQMTFDEAVAGIAGSEEGQAYAATGVPAGSQTATTTTDTSPSDPSYAPNINAAIDAIDSGLYTAEEMADFFGLTLDEFNTVTGQQGGYEGQNEVVTNDTINGGDGNDTITGGDGNDTTDTGMPGPPGGGDVPLPDVPAPVNTDFNPLIQQYYQELFNRQAQQPGLDYFSGRLGSGALTEEGLRDAIISGATGTDKLYYDSSQAYGPVFDATQSLFGRRPARGRYNPETGQLEGGFGQYRRQLDAGELTPEQLRGRLVQLAYNRGQGGGQSGDYQAYLDSLGIDRSGNPFLQDGGTYANVRYGSDLSQYQPDPGMPPPPPGGDAPPPPGGGGMPPTSPMPPGFPGGGMPGKGGRIPGQYITGNQLYSGLPYGMTQPMGMMNFMQPMMQPAMYQPPQMSQQYMPNRGLMSGYSTGFGPYGGYQRPRFGGGKGGRMRPMGGKGGFGY